MGKKNTQHNVAEILDKWRQLNAANKVISKAPPKGSKRGCMKGKGGPQNSLCNYKGVRQRSNGKWVAEIRERGNGPHLWLGTFTTADEAAKAYDDASKAMYGDNARLNLPRPQQTTTLIYESSTSSLPVVADAATLELIETEQPQLCECDQFFETENPQSHDDDYYLPHLVDASDSSASGGLEAEGLEFPSDEMMTVMELVDETIESLPEEDVVAAAPLECLPVPDIQSDITPAPPQQYCPSTNLGDPSNKEAAPSDFALQEPSQVLFGDEVTASDFAPQEPSHMFFDMDEFLAQLSNNTSQDCMSYQQPEDYDYTWTIDPLW